MTSNSLKSYGAIAVAGFCLFISLAANAAKPDKREVCHVPADTPHKTLIIKVGDTALMEHMLHGDWEVTPPMCDGIADNNCDGETDNTDETDAACDDNNPATTDSCDDTVTDGRCFNEPITVCPCESDWQGIQPDRLAWGANPQKITFSTTDGKSCTLTTETFNQDFSILYDPPFFPAQCQKNTTAGTTSPPRFITEEEFNACAAFLDDYGDALNQESDVTVDGVSTRCPTFPQQP